MNYARIFCTIAACAVALSAQAFQGDASPLAGTVSETMEGGRYTYIKVDADDGSHWVASSHFDVAVGDKVTVPGGTPMKNFTSPSLNRTFDSILFAEEVSVAGKPSSSSSKLPPGHPAVSSSPGMGGMGGMGDMGGMGGADQGDELNLSGEVVETMDAGNYTYVLIKDGDRQVWAASDRIEVKPGDHVSVPHGMPVKDFESPTLSRKFDEIIFADAIIKGDAPATGMPPGHGAYGKASAAGTPAAQEKVNIEQPEGGTSIAQIYEQRKDLAGKSVTVRGKVVKYTEHVMGKNWIHIIDGSGEGSTADITITTADSSQIGDIITATGTLSLDEDFGYSYQYPVLIKDATLVANP